MREQRFTVTAGRDGASFYYFKIKSPKSLIFNNVLYFISEYWARPTYWRQMPLSQDNK